jgi:HD superfamily phosphodiesterase
MDFSEAKDYIVERLVTELPKDLYYHGAHHTFDVVKSVHSISLGEKLTNADFFVLLTAAYFHDAGYIYKYERNEPIAVRIVQDVLPKFNYSENEIKIISDIILATESAVQPKTILEEIMCDADHDYFGRHDYQKIAINLRKEFAVYDREYSDEEWLALQINYLENKHQYYTQTAIKTKQELKEAQLKKLKDAYKRLVTV